MKDFSQRARERAEQTEKENRDTAAAIRRAEEHAKEQDKKIADYLRRKSDRTSIGLLPNNKVVLDRAGDGRRLIISFKEVSGPEKWRYHVKENDEQTFTVKSAVKPFQTNPSSRSHH